MEAQTRSLVAFVHVASVDRSIKFYADLGFRVKNTVVPQGQSAPVWAWLESENANLMVGLADGPVDASQQAILFYLYFANIKQTRGALVELVIPPVRSSIRSTCQTVSAGWKTQMATCLCWRRSSRPSNNSFKPKPLRGSASSGVIRHTKLGRDVFVHRSRLCALLIDCNVIDIDQAAGFWAGALGRAMDPDHPGSRDNYRMLETPADEPIVQIQRVDHDSRVHIDIETDDIPAEVARLEQLGAQVVNRLERWVVMQAPTDNASASFASSAQGFQRMHQSGLSRPFNSWLV
jgi:predicted enzyme related to lactoylglutathione lyase